MPGAGTPEATRDATTPDPCSGIFPSMLPVVTPGQARAWDEAAERDGRTLRMLMESAGRAVANLLLLHHDHDLAHGGLIVVGRGNNGGDGWVVARHLHCLGWPVTVASLGEPLRPEAADARRLALSDGVYEVPAAAEWPPVALVVDAIAGGGGEGELRIDVARVLDRIRGLGTPIVAIDGPTGLDLATGANHGALRSLRTVTFGGLRRGHLLAREVVGELHVAEIGLPTVTATWPRLFDLREAAEMYRPFDVRDYKGTRGRVFILGGCTGMTGAARLVARATFAAGAGLVHVATDAESAASLNGAEPDVQVLSTDLDHEAGDELLDVVARADGVVIGPGLGRNPKRRALVGSVVAVSRRIVLDADGLTLFAGRVEELASLLHEKQAILTPHRGEFQALFPDLSLGDPWRAAEAAAERIGQVVLLKGVPTVVGTPEGTLYTSARGNPGLATGGSGDTLSGILAALWSRHDDDPGRLAALGATLHGWAAELAAPAVGVTGMRPMDVTAALASVWHELEHPRRSATGMLLHLPAPAVI